MCSSRWPYGPRARAAASGLDAEEVVEHRDDVVVVEVVPAGRPHHEADDGEPPRLEVAEDLDAGLVLPGGHRALEQRLLVGLDGLRADGGLELEDQPGTDRLDDAGGAALLAVLRVVVVAVLDRVDVHDRAAAGHDRHPVGHQLAAHHQHAGRPGTADELVRREEDRVLVGRGVDAVGRVHVDVDVRRARGEVPEGQGPVGVQQRRDAERVGDDPGHVAGGGERTDLQRPVGVLLELGGELRPGRCGRRRPRGS